MMDIPDPSEVKHPRLCVECDSSFRGTAGDLICGSCGGDQ